MLIEGFPESLGELFPDGSLQDPTSHYRLRSTSVPPGKAGFIYSFHQEIVTCTRHCFRCWRYNSELGNESHPQHILQSSRGDGKPPLVFPALLSAHPLLSVLLPEPICWLQGSGPKRMY